MQLLEDGPLELEESEMFEDELEEVGPAAPDPASLLLATEAPAAAAAVSIHTAQEEGESESDDDGIVLESECSSSGAGRAARHSTRSRSSKVARQLVRFPVCRSDDSRAAHIWARFTRSAAPTLSADAEDEVEQELVGRIQSLQSSLDHPASVNEGVVEGAAWFHCSAEGCACVASCLVTHPSRVAAVAV